MRHDFVVVGARQQTFESRTRRSERLRIFHLQRKQRMAVGGQLGLETRWELQLRSRRNVGVHSADILSDDTTSSRVLRLRPHHP